VNIVQAVRFAEGGNDGSNKGTDTGC